MSEVKPKLIYKFESFNVLSLRNLKAQSIYFGSPQNFNDPYDCAIRAGILKPTSEQVSILRKYYSTQNDTPKQV